MRIVEYTPDRLRMICLQDAQRHMAPYIADDDYAEMLGRQLSYAAVDGEKVIACGGVMPVWEGRAMCWMIISCDAGRYMLALHKAVKRMVDCAPYRRIEAMVDCDFVQGHRWMQMLGFELEAERMRAFDPDGRDYALYAKVRY